MVLIIDHHKGLPSGREKETKAHEFLFYVCRAFASVRRRYGISDDLAWCALRGLPDHLSRERRKIAAGTHKNSKQRPSTRAFYVSRSQNTCATMPAKEVHKRATGGEVGSKLLAQLILPITLFPDTAL